ncbi:Vps62-related protein [Flavobacterium salilacus subsp. salilacus]|uniref:Vps62-related protein n=1 Tax=Flavobacterium TaxID=237 RepID=UPI0010756BCA|nr:MULTISPECIES: Vps62-related protein [Flavobacterium]KAF2519588.1 Vps62-related protein [Flavobacterium salilacus subsp. salilacus]MBE1614510.1 Vps62-related protein [Flavobacterium sp. SaA2.13]
MAKIKISIVNSFKLAWSDKGSGGDMDGAFYNPIDIPIGFHSIGSYGQSNYGSPSGSLVVVKDIQDNVLEHPVDYKLIYTDKGSGADMDGSFWEPIAPDGYVAMGILCVAGYNKPDNAAVVCLREDLVEEAQVGNLIWSDKGTGADKDGSFWEVNVPTGSIKTGTFAGANNQSGSGAVPLYGIKHEVL